VLTETPSLYERLTARKNLTFFGRFTAFLMQTYHNVLTGSSRS
jgi:ABC-type Na+ transport system ATPase subunit NatA